MKRRVFEGERRAELDAIEAAERAGRVQKLPSSLEMADTDALRFDWKKRKWTRAERCQG